MMMMIIIIINIYWRLIIAQSTTRGHLTSGLFTKSNVTEVEYITKHAYFTIYLFIEGVL